VGLVVMVLVHDCIYKLFPTFLTYASKYFDVEPFSS
jgi:hypothetical protein